MFDDRQQTKLKKNKILCWRLKLSFVSYQIQDHPERKSNTLVVLIRAFWSDISIFTTDELRRGICRPGMARLLHFGQSKNSPLSTINIKQVCFTCKICTLTKSQFYVTERGTLNKATKPTETLNLDFKMNQLFSLCSMPNYIHSNFFACMVVSARPSLMKKHISSSEHDDLVDEVELIKASPMYA